MNKFYFFLSIVLFTLIYLFLHYFVYTHIVNGLKLNDIRRALLRAFILCAAISFFLDKLLPHRFFIFSLAYFGSIWLGIISIAFSLFLMQYIVEFTLNYHAKWLTIITLILIFSISCYSLKNALHLRLKEITIPIKNFPAQLAGFSIVQLSDLHLDRIKSVTWLQSIVDKTNELKPDLIVITGDLLDADCDSIFEKFSPLCSRLNAKYGVIAVTGNHEYYAGINKFLKFAQETKITVLENASLTIADALEIVGINDDTGKRFAQSGANLRLALEACDRSKPIILLSHTPKGFSRAIDMGIDLQLSGHTHAGQLLPFNFIIKWLYRHAYGLHTENSSFIYTTSGTGTWGPPMRLFSSSEIVKIVLTE
ncbi:MAG: metallophosphoesterase [bacterium]